MRSMARSSWSFEGILNVLQTNTAAFLVPCLSADLAPSSLGWDHTLHVRALGLAPDGTVLTLGIGDLS